LPAFDHVFGLPIFEYYSKNPEAAAIFDRAMTSISMTEARAAADAYDFKGVDTLMDVAGGHGQLLATVLRRYKKMRGVLFELPHVAAGAAATFTRAGITGRVRIASGDFFKELPSGADAIMMKHIIHDWDDDSAMRILQTCHRALAKRGKVLILDPVVPTGNTPHYGKLLDLEMLVLTPRGRERTKRIRGAAAGRRFSPIADHCNQGSVVGSRSRKGVTLRSYGCRRSCSGAERD
jgi:SAM-dependent methyltransferase